MHKANLTEQQFVALNITNLAKTCLRLFEWDP